MERFKLIEDGNLPSSRGKIVPGKTEQCVCEGPGAEGLIERGATEHKPHLRGSMPW